MNYVEYISSYVQMFYGTYGKDFDDYKVTFDDVKRKATIIFRRADVVVERELMFVEIADNNSCDLVMDHLLICMYIEVMRGSGFEPDKKALEKVLETPVNED